MSSTIANKTNPSDSKSEQSTRRNSAAWFRVTSASSQDNGKRPSMSAVREELSESLAILRSLDERIHAHHRDDNEICDRYTDYLAVSPSSYLDRAAELLGKDFYRVAFCGPFSCGKSTLINALLREAGLLPSAAGECTLSITNLAKPAAGKGEHVEVHYFTKEEALKNVFTNIRYKPLFGTEGEAIIAEFSNKRALLLLNEEIATTGQGRCEVEISTNELAKRRLELREFCEQLSDKESQGKLGSVVYDSIKASSQYLTTDHDGTGMGHLLLIQMVNIYKDNEMFARDGIEIIDLPGTDSINERQRELTHAYLNEADVVVNVLDPRGFSAADKAIESVLRGATLSSIKNKMFFVVNRFDTLLGKDMDELGKLKRLIDGQIRNEIVRSGLNADWLYFTSALWAELESQSELTTTDRQQIEGFRRNGQDRMSQLKDLGEFEGLSEVLRTGLDEVYQNSGLDRFRGELLGYLKSDIERERLREIKTYLDRVVGHLEHMLAPQKGEVTELLQSTRHRVRQVGEFLDRVDYDTRTAFRDVQESLGANGNKRFEGRLKKINKRFERRVAETLASDNPRLDFNDIAAEVGVNNPQTIMTAIVDRARKVFAGDFVELTVNDLAPAFTELTFDRLEACQNEAVLAHFSKALREDDSFLATYSELKKRFERDIRELTTKRSTEETWIVDELDLAPEPRKRAWDEATEARFRSTYTAVFKDVFRDRYKAMSAVLLRYYELALNDFTRGFEELVAKMREEARHQSMTIPVELFEHKSDQATLRKYKLADYITSLEDVQERFANNEEFFTD